MASGCGVTRLFWLWSCCCCAGHSLLRLASSCRPGRHSAWTTSAPVSVRRRLVHHAASMVAVMLCLCYNLLRYVEIFNLEQPEPVGERLSGRRCGIYAGSGPVPSWMPHARAFCCTDREREHPCPGLAYDPRLLLLLLLLLLHVFIHVVLP